MKNRRDEALEDVSLAVGRYYTLSKGLLLKKRSIAKGVSTFDPITKQQARVGFLNLVDELSNHIDSLISQEDLLPALVKTQLLGTYSKALAKLRALEYSDFSMPYNQSARLDRYEVPRLEAEEIHALNVISEESLSQNEEYSNEIQEPEEDF